VAIGASGQKSPSNATKAVANLIRPRGLIIRGDFKEVESQNGKFSTQAA
jgi:hypothetical protein